MEPERDNRRLEKLIAVRLDKFYFEVMRCYIESIQLCTERRTVMKNTSVSFRLSCCTGWPDTGTLAYV
jgi:hypothetical protein